MGYGSRKSKVYRPVLYHPYKQECRVTRCVQRTDSLVTPSFADIEFEIIRDTPGDSPPQWVINESGDAYAFSIQGHGLQPTDVEVKLELVGQLELGTPDSEFYSRALLTILCERLQYSLEPRFGELAFQNSSDGLFSHCWKYARRFRLPVDASPETATAAHDNGILTVVVPRRSPDSKACSFARFHSNPSLKPSMDNVQFLRPFFGCGQWITSEKQKRVYTLQIDGSCSSQTSYDGFPGHASSGYSNGTDDRWFSSMCVDSMEA